MKIEIIKRVTKQLVLPVIIAGAFTIYDGLNNPAGLTIVSSAKVFFPALFFIMYFYGQYKRVEKQTEDRASFEELSTNISTIKDAVEGLQANTSPAVATFTVSQASDKPHMLMDEALELQKQGKNIASLLQAGLAFELAVRKFASRIMKTEEYVNLSLLDVLRKIEKHVPKDIIGELHTLRQIRNRITHIRETELLDLPDVELTMNGYKWAMNTLENLEKDIPF
jgi:hypothetical protein